MTPSRPVVALVAPADREGVGAVLDALRPAGVVVAESADAAGSASHLLFFASGESTAPGCPLLKAALDARRRGAPVVAVVVDDLGESVVAPWNLAVTFDARAHDPGALAEAVHGLLPTTGAPVAETAVARPKLFISYSGADHPFVQRLTAWLVTQGWEAWEYKSGPRDRRYKLNRELGELIAGSAGVLFVLTPDWMRSPHCLDELDTTAALRKPAEYLYVRRCDVTAIEHNTYSSGALRIDFTADEGAAFRALADRLRQLKRV